MAASILIKCAHEPDQAALLRDKIRSAALKADAWNDTVDVLSGTTALVGLGLTLINPQQFSAADHIGGAAVGLIVIFLGVRVVRDTTLQLMDTMPDAKSMDQIRRLALGVPGRQGHREMFCPQNRSKVARGFASGGGSGHERLPIA